MGGICTRLLLDIWHRSDDTGCANTGRDACQDQEFLWRGDEAIREARLQISDGNTQ